MPFKIPLCTPFVHVTSGEEKVSVKHFNILQIDSRNTDGPIRISTSGSFANRVNTVCKQKLPGPELSSAHLCHSVWRVIA